MDLRQLDLQSLAQFQVECAERLVEQEHGGTLDEGARDGDPLLLAAGELCGRPVAQLLETDEGERFAHALRALRTPHTIHAQSEPDVLPHGHVREQGVRLEDRVHRSLVRRQVVDAAAAQPDGSLRRPDEAADQVQRCRLATAGWAEQAEELAVADVEVEGLQCDVVAVPLRDCAQLDPGASRPRIGWA